MKYLIATRASLLAKAQAEAIAESLRTLYSDCHFQLMTFKTQGDVAIDRPLRELESTGFFVKELEEALLVNRADFAVHSLKDLPSRQPEGLFLCSIPRRAGVHDLLVTGTGAGLEDLPTGAIVGTGSPRRIRQLAIARGDLVFRDIRGNVDTRLEKLQSGQYDALVLAQAAIERLHLKNLNYQVLDASLCVPAPGQGALALECRRENKDMVDRLRSLNDEETAQCVKVEREIMTLLEAGCQLPIGVYASLRGDSMHIRVFIAGKKSDVFLKEEVTLPRGRDLQESRNFGLLMREKARREGIL